MLVVMDDIDSPVQRVTALASRMIAIAPSRPALPTTQPRRRYMITPRIVSTVGVKTPPKVPNLRFVRTPFFSSRLTAWIASRIFLGIFMSVRFRLPSGEFYSSAVIAGSFLLYCRRVADRRDRFAGSI